MAENRIFPRLLVDMVYIGEKTDTLQSSFATMADFYEKKLDQKVQRLLAMVEPASIIIVGLIISLYRSGYHYPDILDIPDITLIMLYGSGQK